MSTDIAKETVQLYDNIASDYDMHMATTGHYDAQKKLFERLRQYFKEPILDVASGPGYLSNLMVESGSTVIANDASLSMVKILSKRFKDKPNAQVLNMYANQITLDHAVRTILCSNLFYYLPDQKGAIINWMTNLEDRGHIIVFEEYPFLKSKTGPMSKHENRLGELVTPVEPDQLRQRFVDCGLKLVEVTYTSIDDMHNLYGSVFEK